MPLLYADLTNQGRNPSNIYISGSKFGTRSNATVRSIALSTQVCVRMRRLHFSHKLTWLCACSAADTSYYFEFGCVRTTLVYQHFTRFTCWLRRSQLSLLAFAPRFLFVCIAAALFFILIDLWAQRSYINSNQTSHIHTHIHERASALADFRVRAPRLLALAHVLRHCGDRAVTIYF